MEHAVAEAGALFQEADRVKELDRRLAVQLENLVELLLVHRGMKLEWDVQLVRGASRRAQEVRRARVHLARIDHGADPPVVRAVVLLRVVDGAVQAGLALAVRHRYIPADFP